MMRVKKNDTVVVLSGKYKGKRGSVLSVDPSEGKILVKGIAIMTRHVKARRQGEVSGIRKEEAPIHSDKVMPVCPSCDKPCRINVKISDNAIKARVCNRCKATL